MSNREFKKLVEKFNGWLEYDSAGCVAYFPSPYLKELFLKEYDCAGTKQLD